jgi:hypothetical protein
MLLAFRQVSAKAQKRGSAGENLRSSENHRLGDRRSAPRISSQHASGDRWGLLTQRSRRAPRHAKIGDQSPVMVSDPGSNGHPQCQRQAAEPQPRGSIWQKNREKPGTGNFNHGLRGFSRMGKRAGAKAEHPTSNVEPWTSSHAANDLDYCTADGQKVEGQIYRAAIAVQRPTDGGPSLTATGLGMACRRLTNDWRLKAG